MKTFGYRWMRRLLCGERGQGAAISIVTMSMMIALAGASVETSHIYYAYQLLVASTNAATLAGAQAMPDTTRASANVTLYSSKSGQLNASQMLTNVTVTPTFQCSSGVTNNFNVPCMTATGASGGYNALKVTQTATVPLWFGGLIGMRSMNITAVSTAAMRGGANTPWNIAVILDTTGSMNNSDFGTQKNCTTQIKCAEKGIQTLLKDLYPCDIGQDCTSATNYVDAVSLYVFPPVLKSTAPEEYCSGGTSPTQEHYSVPDLPSNWTYNIISFANDYRTSDSTTGLNTGSDIVKAVATSKTHCSGVTANGSTFYAQVIYQAQADLITQQNSNSHTLNAMIILSDGDATAGAGGWMQASSTNSLNGVSGHNPTSYAYPSINGECGQAVIAAKAAADAGTKVFTIGYGTETSGSCLSDKTYSATVTTNGGSWGPGKQACQAMAAMASAQVNFYSDNANGCVATAASNQNITDLASIFHAITNTLTAPRLIPNGT